VLAIFPKLGQRLDQPNGTLSGGERKMLVIARAMLGDPSTFGGQ
jgi:branched-chain amino acid transport system ATP-binding protein